MFQCRLKYCTARSWVSAFSRDGNVPRLRRFPVFAFFLREYNRYCPDLSLRIIGSVMRHSARMWAFGTREQDRFPHL